MKNSTNVSEHTSSFRRAQGRALLAPTQPALAPRSPEGVGGDSLTLGTSGDRLPCPSPLDPWLDNQPLGRCFKQRAAVVSVLLHRGKILPLCLPSIVSNGLPSGIEGTKARAALSPPTIREGARASPVRGAHQSPGFGKGARKGCVCAPCPALPTRDVYTCSTCCTPAPPALGPARLKRSCSCVKASLPSPAAPPGISKHRPYSISQSNHKCRVSLLSSPLVLPQAGTRRGSGTPKSFSLQALPPASGLGAEPSPSAGASRAG